jgi:hypothetical protein
MKHATAVVFVLLLMPMIAGCGKKPSDSVAEKAIEHAMEANGDDAEVSVNSGGVQIKSKDGDFSMGEGTKLPEDWPGDIPVYTGAKLQSAAKSGDGLTVQAFSTDSLDKVTTFYKERLKKEGWTEDSATTQPQMVMLSYSKDARSLMVMLAGQDAATSITISAGKK